MRCRHELSLFAHISGITWDFNKPATFSGTVSDVKSGDIRQFDVDPSRTSQYELVNKIWQTL